MLFYFEFLWRKADGQLCGQRHSLIAKHHLIPQDSVLAKTVLLTLKKCIPTVNSFTPKKWYTLQFINLLNTMSCHGYRWTWAVAMVNRNRIISMYSVDQEKVTDRKCMKVLCRNYHRENPTSYFRFDSVNLCLEGPSHIFRYYTWISSLTGWCIR